MKNCCEKLSNNFHCARCDAFCQENDSNLLVSNSNDMNAVTTFAHFIMDGIKF